MPAPGPAERRSVRQQGGWPGPKHDTDRGHDGQQDQRRGQGEPRAAAGLGASRRQLQQDAIDPDRLGDVLQMLLAERLEPHVKLVPGVVVGGSGDDDPVRLTDPLQPGGDIDAIAVDVVAIDDDVAEIDADPERDPRVLGKGSRWLAIERWISTAHATASTTLANSTSAPSPMSFTMRPW